MILGSRRLFVSLDLPSLTRAKVKSMHKARNCEALMYLG